MQKELKRIICKDYCKNILDCFLYTFQDRVKYTYIYDETQKEYTYIFYKASKKDLQILEDFRYNLGVALAHAGNVDGF